MKLIVLMLALLFSGCGATLKPDAVPIAAIDAMYPEAEFYVAGKRHKGQAIILVSPGQSLDELNASVQAYFKGSVRIDSRRCNIAKSVNYVRTQKVSMGLTGPVRESCLVTFVVTPELPRQVQSEQEVRGYRGHLLLKMIQPSDVWRSLSVKSPTRPHLLQDVLAQPGEELRLVATGCGLTIRESLKADATGLVQFDLGDAVENKKQTCILEAGLFGSSSLLITTFVSLYDPKYTPLPAALITDNDEKNQICITSDPSVTLLAVEQGESLFYRVDGEGCLTFDHTQPGVFRALTVKGRTSVLEYSPETGWSEVK